jgi:hypothetical protein
MLHETISDASVEFVFSGGGGQEFCWRINGWIRDADSEEEAVSKAASLRQNLLLVLASEPAMRFQNGDAEEQLVPVWNSLQGVSFEAQTLLLNVPQTASLGFAQPQPDVTAGNLLVSLPRPSRLTRSFSSVADVVANSPARIHLSVKLRRFDLTSVQQQQVADTLTWVSTTKTWSCRARPSRTTAKSLRFLRRANGNGNAETRVCDLSKRVLG